MHLFAQSAASMFTPSDWLVLGIFVIGQTAAVSTALMKLAGNMGKLNTKVDEVIQHRLQEGDRRLDRLESRIFDKASRVPERGVMET